MNASAHNFSHTAPLQIGGQIAAMRWAALADAGAVAAMLAQVEDEAADTPITPAFDASSPLQGERVEQAMAQLSTTMETGLGALLAVRESGANVQPAAHALWREFAEARDAIIVLLNTE